MTESISAALRVGRHVRAALVESAKTQQDVAVVLGLTHQAVSRRLLGQTAFRVDELIAIAEYLGVEPARFFRPIPQPRRAPRAEPAHELGDDVDAEADLAGARAGAA